MRKKLVVLLSFLFIFLQLKYVNAEDLKYAEIFDPKQDKVVKVVHLNPEIQNMVAGWVMSIEDVYGKNDPTTDDGYAVKIPLDPAIKVHTKALNASVSEVYIIIPENDLPFYLIFEGENKLSSFAFNGDLEALSNSLDFKLNNNR